VKARALYLLLWACGQPTPSIVEARAQTPLGFAEPSKDCLPCHETQVEDWASSPHAYAMVDPVFHALVRLGQRATEGKLGQFCVQCHSPIALALQTSPVYRDPTTGVFRQDTETVGALGQAGVSCDACHAMTSVLEPVNGHAVLAPDGVRHGPIRDPQPTTAHASAYSPLHEDSLLCGVCHAVTNPKHARIEETYGEWQHSTFSQPGGKTCQGCHMPASRGPAVVGGPERTLHRHTFVGVDVSLVEPTAFPGYQRSRELAQALLEESCEVSLKADPHHHQLQVWLHNLAGHALPSGASAERQLWVELLVRDADGKEVFETGTLDELGDLRDEHSTRPDTDPQLIVYYQQLLDDPRLTNPLSNQAPRFVSLPWEANSMINHVIAADATEVRTVDLSSLGGGDYVATMRLRFRTFPPWLLRTLEREAGLDPQVKTRVPTVTIAERSVSFSLPQ
jgi:nitrate/TMAO reductase-like tetraheme cytochrome c subunit